MTDQELVKLVRGTLPEELSSQEIVAIRHRLRECTELRDALREQIALEVELVCHLGRVEIAADDLWRQHSNTPRRRPVLAMTALLLFLASVGGGAAYLFLIPEKRGDKAPQNTAVSVDAEPDAPIVERPEPSNGPQEQPVVEPRKPLIGSHDQPPPPEAPPTRRQRERVARPARERNRPAVPPARQKGAVASPASPAPTAPAPESWPELDQRPAPFTTTAFLESSDPTIGLSQSQLTRWLDAVPGNRSRFVEETRGKTPVAGFEGLVRLRASWPPEAVLRMAPFEHDGLALHFWRGSEGVSFYYYEHPRPVWAAYRTVRQADQPRPTSHVLLTTDSDRYDRSFRGVIDVRHQAGTLVLSRGDLRLLTVPLEMPPAEVFFDRRAKFRTFTMFRGESMPDDPEAGGTKLLSNSPPAQLTWTGELPAGTKLIRNPGGSAVLSRDTNARSVWTGLQLPHTGLYEVIVQIDDATPGTGIYLGDEQGQPTHIVGLRRNIKGGLPVFGFLKPGEKNLDTDGTVATQLVPCAGPGQWLRIVPGCGTVKCWISGDGRHWGRMLEPLQGTKGGMSHIGLIALQTTGSGHIGIRSLQVRELTELIALADKNLLEKVPQELLQPLPFLSWCSEVLAAQPPDISAAAWRSACAVRTLGHGRQGIEGNQILLGLLQDVLDREAPADIQRQILDQAAVVFDAWEPREADRLLQLYDRLGRSLAQRGDAQPYSLPGRSLMAGPIWCSVPYQVFPEALVRAESLGLAYKDEWTALRELCIRLRFWNRASQPDQPWPDHRLRVRRLVEWGELRAQEALGDAGESVGRETPGSLRRPHPVVAQSNKEGLNVLAELQVALADEQYDEASRIVLATRREQLSGLLPAPGDPHLFESLTQVIVTALRERPEWRKTMVERFGTLGRMRVEQAIERDAIGELQTLAVQFSGTPAAAAAYRCLGDRALVDGNFTVALAEYQRGRQAADPEQIEGIAGRERLAAALLGRQAGARISQPLALADRTLSPVEFEDLLAELSRNRARTETSVDSVTDRSGQVDPVVWQAEKIDEGKGLTGPPPKPDAGEIDWAARQMSLQTASGFLYVSSPWQISCYNLSAGNRVWVHVLAAPGRTLSSWPLLSLTPAVTADRVFVRRPQRSGPGLVCLDAVTGKEQWGTDPNLVIFSDPRLVQGQVYCFVATSLPQDRNWELELAAFDPQSGDIRMQVPVIELYGAGDRMPSCQVAFTGTRLIGAIGGAVLCCDLTGSPLWLRRQTWFPAVADVAAGEQDYGTPIVVGDRVIVMQPGVRDLVCLNAESGNLLWHIPTPDGRRVLGCDDRQVYLETARGIAAISIGDGRVAWLHPVGEMLDAYLLSNNDSLLYTRHEDADADKLRPLMVWLNTRTGRESAAWPLAELTGKHPQLGPFIQHGDQLFAMFAPLPGGGPRSLWRLSPTTETAFTAHADPQSVDRWTGPADDSHLQFLAARFLPDWSLLGGAVDPDTGVRDEFQGQEEVLVTASTPNQPVVFTREIRLEPGSRPRLVITAGHEPSESWLLRVRVAGRVIHSATVDSKSVKKNWGRWEVDLSRFAGHSVRLVVEQLSAGRQSRAYWKPLEIVR